LRNILRPANNNEVEAPKGVLPEKRFSPWRAKRLRPATIQRPTLWLAAFRRTIPELAAYAIIALTETDDFERRWVLLKGERAAQN
jgi:hypothetical protein